MNAWRTMAKPNILWDGEPSLTPEVLARRKRRTDLTFPQPVISGLAGDFTDVYSSVMESPPHFFFMAFLTCLGSYLSERVSINSALPVQPRLFTILLGESGVTRKSTAITQSVGFFKFCLSNAPHRFGMSEGVGSAEGMHDLFAENKQLLLCHDEFSSFVAKTHGQTSNLLPCVCSLFEKTSYSNTTKKNKGVIDEAYLSMLAASTIDTYERIWRQEFTDIGFSNRVFLVPGNSERRFSLPPPFPKGEKERLRTRLIKLVKKFGDHFEFEITPNAFGAYDYWYKNEIEKDDLATRLDTYSLRLMLILAINEDLKLIDERIAERAIELCNWQLRVRKVYTPIVSNNPVAEFEQKILKTLKTGAKYDKRDLSRKIHYEKHGIAVFNKAIENLIGEFEIYRDGETLEYYIPGMEPI